MTRTPPWPPDPSIDRSTVRVFSEWGCPETPLWGVGGPVHPAELGIPGDLTAALIAWNLNWEPSLDTDGGWISPEARAASSTRGHQLFARLQDLDIPDTTFAAQFDDSLPMREGLDGHEDPYEDGDPVRLQRRT